MTKKIAWGKEKRKHIEENKKSKSIWDTSVRSDTVVGKMTH